MHRIRMILRIIWKWLLFHTIQASSFQNVCLTCCHLSEHSENCQNKINILADATQPDLIKPSSFTINSIPCISCVLPAPCSGDYENSLDSYRCAYFAGDIAAAAGSGAPVTIGTVYRRARHGREQFACFIRRPFELGGSVQPQSISLLCAFYCQA